MIENPVEPARCIVVGIGASAGGLKALESFFAVLPAKTGKAYVVVMHLSPDHPSHVAELLHRVTEVPVVQIESEMVVVADHVYVIPPGKCLKLEGMSLILEEQPVLRGARLSIDPFFESLARSVGKRAVGIIFSGSGRDGSEGLRAIKDNGGLTIVQTPDSAEFRDMPINAISTCTPDFILDPDKMLCALLSRGPDGLAGVEDIEDEKPSHFEKAILEQVLRRTGRDFSMYKMSTIGRRIQRRLAFLGVTSHQVYLELLENNPAEARALVADFLIGVTTFFRDVECFQALEQLLRNEITKKLVAGVPVRIWVPGCSTGEEAYSIAMLCKETLSSNPRHAQIQIFATDLDANAIKVGRTAVYSHSIAETVSASRCDEFFVRTDDGYQVKREIREMVVFAVHDIVKDPPYLNLDLISCRNLFIYLESELQKKLLPVFHRCLNKEGILFLGHSEGVGIASSLFSIIDNEARLFRRKDQPDANSKFVTFYGFAKKSPVDSAISQAAGMERNEQQELAYIKTIAETVLPPSMLVRGNGDIVFIQKRAEIFLSPKRGNLNINLLNDAHLKLRRDLGACLKKACNTRIEAVQSNVRVEIAGKQRTLTLRVKPVPGLALEDRLYVVTFVNARKSSATRVPSVKGKTIKGLALELAETKKVLQQTIDELEKSYEEHQEVSEQSQSSSEEMQSTNEELETTKEEFQSLNEELTTVNAELQLRIDEFTSTENDLTNLLASVDLGIIFLDLELRIRRFTPKMTKIIRIINIDVGRHITDIVSNVGDLNIAESVHEVLETLTRKEVEVKDKSGAWFLMRIVPYRTLTNMIDGVVISFADISTQKAEQN